VVRRFVQIPTRSVTEIGKVEGEQEEEAVVDEPRERDDEGVLIAPADAARREAGA
jgi:hypothetical protein